MTVSLDHPVLSILFVIMIFIVNPQGQGGRGWRRRRRAKIHLNIVLYYWPSVASPTTSPFPDKVWVVWEEDKIRVLTKFAAGIKIKPNFKKLHKISGGERKVLSSSVFPHHSLLLLEEIFSLLLSQTTNFCFHKSSTATKKILWIKMLSVLHLCRWYCLSCNLLIISRQIKRHFPKIKIKFLDFFCFIKA